MASGWPPTAPQLPNGWAEYIDSARGLPYWHHAASGETTWVNPCAASGYANPASPSAVPQYSNALPEVFSHQPLTPMAAAPQSWEFSVPTQQVPQYQPSPRPATPPAGRGRGMSATLPAWMSAQPDPIMPSSGPAVQQQVPTAAVAASMPQQQPPPEGWPPGWNPESAQSPPAPSRYAHGQNPLAFAAAGTYSNSSDSVAAAVSGASANASSSRLGSSSSSSSSGNGSEFSMAALGQSVDDGWAASGWVAAAEAAFAAVAPPSAHYEQTGWDGQRLSSSVVAMDQHAAALGEEGDFYEEMLAARAALLAEDDARLFASFQDPIPEKHRERLRRAKAKNMEWILKQDAAARKRTLDQFDQAHHQPSHANTGGGPGWGRGGWRGIPSTNAAKPAGGAGRTGGIGSGAAPSGPAHSGRGAGGAQSGTVPSGPNTAVYVSGLAPNVTWTSLDTLFSVHGRVKRIKVYRDAGGVPKGDALITFAKVGSVQAACSKLTGSTTQGAGYVLSVEPASFAHRAHEADGQNNGSGGGENGGYNEEEEDGEDDDEEGAEEEELVEYDLDANGVPIYKPLPPLCLPAELPAVVLRNLYTDEELTASGPSFLEELEGEIIVEATRFGTVKCVVTLPQVAYYFGSCVVTFTEVASAQACAETMNGRSFADGFIQVQALGNWGDGEIVPPPPPAPPPVEEEAGGAETGGALVKEGQQASGNGGGEDDDLADFFSSVDEISAAVEGQGE